jgi:hypothetical protein
MWTRGAAPIHAKASSSYTVMVTGVGRRRGLARRRARHSGRGHEASGRERKACTSHCTILFPRSVLALPNLSRIR